MLPRLVAAAVCALAQEEVPAAVKNTKSAAAAPAVVVTLLTLQTLPI